MKLTNNQWKYYWLNIEDKYSIDKLEMIALLLDLERFSVEAQSGSRNLN